MRLSAGFACHHCDASAPTTRDGFFVYLTDPEREDAAREPSCWTHATWRRLRDTYVRIYALAS